MKKFQFITKEFIDGYNWRWYIEASSLEEACKKASNLGLLRGHMIRRRDGKWDKGYNLDNTGLYPDYNWWPEGEPVFMAIEDYWSPCSISIVRQDDGYYASVYKDRKQNSKVEENLSLLQAFAKAKDFCNFNNIRFRWNDKEYLRRYFRRW